ncbi:MAG: hypothetical protein HUU50_11230 [Candidatus Brocadiae bacterium]|nr:hypothetical protein [Candidatus Brocadiia bacterium]
MSAEEKKILFLISQLQDQNLDLGLQASEMLVKLGKDVVPYLLPLLDGKEWSFRFRIASLIQKIGIQTQEAYLAVEKVFQKEKDKDLLKKLRQALAESEREILSDIYIPSGQKNHVVELELKKIEWFEAEESMEIEETFKNKGYIFQKKCTVYSHPEWDNYYERHIFLVHERNFDDAIQDILEYFGFGKNQEQSFSGECPACGTENDGVEECEECGLNLSFSPSKAIMEHPFFAFLLENGLLPQAKG